MRVIFEKKKTFKEKVESFDSSSGFGQRSDDEDLKIISKYIFNALCSRQRSLRLSAYR